MRIIARGTLLKFTEALKGTSNYRAVKASLDAWYHEVRSATWESPADVKKQYRTASIVGSERVVFNIKGNDYRLIVSVDYRRQIVYIKWIGTHREYDSVNVLKVEHAD